MIVDVISIASGLISIGLAIYAICATIDFLRLKCIEEPFFRWYDKKPRFVRLQDFLKE